MQPSLPQIVAAEVAADVTPPGSAVIRRCPVTHNDRQAHTEDRRPCRYPETGVNQGGEPGHDDYGLPPIDIEIPDDAAESIVTVGDAVKYIDKAQA